MYLDIIEKLERIGKVELLKGLKEDLDKLVKEEEEDQARSEILEIRNGVTSSNEGDNIKSIEKVYGEYSKEDREGFQARLKVNSK